MSDQLGLALEEAGTLPAFLEATPDPERRTVIRDDLTERRHGWTEAQRLEAEHNRGNRHAYSCSRCSEWVFVDVPEGERRPELEPAACLVCEATGTLKHRGKVARTGAVESHRLEVPCNTLCTGAVGPHCDCKCRGENHGSMRLVLVRYVEGHAPTLEASSAKAVSRRATLLPLLAEIDELEAAIAEHLEARYGRVLELRRTGAWLSPEDFHHYLRAGRHRQAVRKAKAYKLPKKRRDTLAKLLDELRG